jgi:hypothetical protein
MKQPQLRDRVIASRAGKHHEKNDVGVVRDITIIDSDKYVFVETDDGRIIGPSCIDYWEKYNDKQIEHSAN